MKKIVLIAIVAIGLSLVAPPVMALSLARAPVYQEIPVGGSAVVDLVVACLCEHIPESLGGCFDDSANEPSIPTITQSDVAHRPSSGDPANDASDSFVSNSSGGVDLDRTSFLPDVQPDAMQPGTFDPALLSFTGTAPGFSILDGLATDLSDAFGYSFENATTNAAGVASIPESTTLLLLGTSLIGVAGLSKKRFIRPYPEGCGRDGGVAPCRSPIPACRSSVRECGAASS